MAKKNLTPEDRDKLAGEIAAIRREIQAVIRLLQARTT
jgi:hypothetical protein